MVKLSAMKRRELKKRVGELPPELVQKLARHLMANPEVDGRAKGLLRLTCKSWSSICLELTTHLSPSCRAVDQNMFQLAQLLPNLCSLDLGRCTSITSLGMLALAPLKERLTALVLPESASETDSWWLTGLLHLQRLQSLDLSNYPLQEDFMRQCDEHWPALTRLCSRAQCVLKLNDFSSWQGVGRLRELILPKTAVRYLSGDMVSQLQATEYLDFSRSEFHKGALAKLEHCTALRTLKLGECPGLARKAYELLHAPHIKALQINSRDLSLLKVLMLKFVFLADTKIAFFHTDREQLAVDCLRWLERLVPIYIFVAGTPSVFQGLFSWSPSVWLLLLVAVLTQTSLAWMF